MTNTTEVMTKALRKVTAAAGGLGFKAVAIGAVAHQAWGVKREIPGLDVLISSNSGQRESFLSALRGEGLQQSPDGPLRLRYTDAKLGATVPVDLTEASTPFHSQVMTRAQWGDVLSVGMLVATCEDLILLGADRAVLVELLRNNMARIDGAYLKKEAEAAGVFNEVKLAWQQAKQ
jgi:hypothetical protein